MQVAVVQDVVDQHAVDAPFLWVLRDHARQAPDTTAAQFAAIDARLEAHLAALRLAGPAGLATAAGELERFPDDGEAFVAAVLTLDADGVDAFIDLVVPLLSRRATVRGVVSALGWAETAVVRERARRLLGHELASVRALGLAALSTHRLDPEKGLTAFLEDDPAVRARALRLVGELGRVDMAPAVRASFRGSDPMCRFWAGWSAALLGDRDAAFEILSSHVAPGDLGWRAVTVLLRAMDRDAAAEWVRSDASVDRRMQVIGAGVTGDPRLLPWLLDQMHSPDLARLAAESVGLITGIDLEKNSLAAPDAPEDADDRDLSAEDEWIAAYQRDLPFPSLPETCEHVFRRLQGFSDGRRYIMGCPKEPEWLAHLDTVGSQRVRLAAALDTAFLASDMPLRNCSARIGQAVAMRNLRGGRGRLLP